MLGERIILTQEVSGNNCAKALGALSLPSFGRLLAGTLASQYLGGLLLRRLNAVCYQGDQRFIGQFGDFLRGDRTVEMERDRPAVWNPAATWQGVVRADDAHRDQGCFGSPRKGTKARL